MGGGRYDVVSRSVRSDSLGYQTKGIDDIFEQNKKRQIHESMVPSKALLRESRDSDEHPLSVPIIIGLDVTGSMGRIPHYLIKDGLPKLVSTIIERGIADPQILFLAIGDHRSDSYPLQVGQFESADAEMDMWLTRTYLEGNGGGNGGESYSLAWYFGAHHTSIDSWEKRKQKGFIFTIGDEPCHYDLPSRAIEGIMGVNSEKGHNSEELLKSVQETYNVYHLHLLQGSHGDSPVRGWKSLLNENCIVVNQYEELDKIISDIVVSNLKTSVLHDAQVPDKTPGSNVTIKNDQEIIL